MINTVIMPKQGLQMTEGVITKWFYTVGDTVKANKPLFQMETDKLTIDIDSQFDGILLGIIHDEGETVLITEPIAYIGSEGDYNLNIDLQLYVNLEDIK
jgi:pyruvate/2-oxoglutarate dehydrogenase complex dihydrolipoamide acyltransferase (E2) component